MDMDLRPPTRPQPLPPQPSVQQLPQDDPFKSDSEKFAPPATSGKVKKSRGKGGKTFLKILLVLVLLGGVGYGVYYWQHQQVDKLAKENEVLTAQVAAANAKITEIESKEAEVVAKPTADEQVIAVVKARCEAGIDEATKKPLVYIQGTTKDKNVIYSTDKNFAYVNYACGKTAADKEGNGRATYLKMVGDEWVFLYTGQDTDPLSTKLYAIPALTDFK